MERHDLGYRKSESLKNSIRNTVLKKGEKEYYGSFNEVCLLVWTIPGSPLDTMCWLENVVKKKSVIVDNSLQESQKKMRTRLAF